jgi:tyrosine-protein phosphatase SIW14
MFCLTKLSEFHRNKFVYPFLFLFFASVQFTYAASRHFPEIKISNFGQINEQYYRGGQPYASDCAALKKLGIKTVIDLQKDGPFQESSWVQNAGMQYFNIPLSGSHPATAEQMEYFLKLVNDPLNFPVYVHCAAGRHRTGAMTAVYRITHDSWTADRAYLEMKQYGYYSFPNHGSLKDSVYKYYENYRRVAKDIPVTVPLAVPKPFVVEGTAN